MVRLQGITKDNSTQPVLNTIYLKSNASNDNGLIQVDDVFNLTYLGEQFIYKTNNIWNFVIYDSNITIMNNNGSITNTAPLTDILMNQTGVYDQATNKPLDFGKDYNKTSIHCPYVIQVDDYLPIMRIFDQNKTLLK